MIDESGSGSGLTGIGLTGLSVGQGVNGFLAENITTINLALTALSCLGGLIFLFLNWRQNKRRTDIMIDEYERKLAAC